MADLCAACQRRLIAPTGDPKSRVLFVGDRPGFEEHKTGLVLTGPTGEVFDAELSRLGVSRPTVRVTNLWQHDPIEAEKPVHVKRLVQEIKGRSAVFFMGADCAYEFAGQAVSNISGIPVYPISSRKRGFSSALLPKGLQVAVFAPNPAIALQRSNQAVIGEFRDALELFIEICKKEAWIL